MWGKRTILAVVSAATVFVGLAVFYFVLTYGFWEAAPAVGGLAGVDIGVAVADCALPRPFIRGGKKFWVALLATLIPIVVVIIFSMIALENRWKVHIFELLVYAASGLFLTALIVASVFFIKGRKEISRGMWVANGLAIVFLLGGWSGFTYY